jgi:hypothetical protein
MSGEGQKNYFFFLFFKTVCVLFFEIFFNFTKKKAKMMFIVLLLFLLFVQNRIIIETYYLATMVVQVLKETNDKNFQDWKNHSHICDSLFISLGIELEFIKPVPYVDARCTFVESKLK